MKTVKAVGGGADYFTEINGRRIHFHVTAEEHAEWCRLSDADLAERIGERLDAAIRESQHSFITAG
jgi:hypothetical protein